MCFTFSFRSSQAKDKDRSKVCLICLKEDGLILTANCTCVAGCVFIFFSFIFHLSFSFSRRINICYIKPRGYTTLTEHAEDILDKILCTFTIGCSSTRNSLLFSNFTQRILHHIYFMYHTIKILVVL